MSTMLQEIQDIIGRTAQQIGDAVVGIGRRSARGSGVVIGTNQVLTNAHNLRRDVAWVSFHDGRTAEGSVVAADYDKDLAIIEVDTGPIVPLDPTAADSATIGTPVVALSNPGGRGLRVTMGFVSGTERTFRGPRGRSIRGSLEHTAPLLPGSSWGPVVDVDGRLLGINTNRLGEGFYLAIPAGDELARLVERLRTGSSGDRPRLGVGVAPNDVARKMRRAVGLEEAKGLLVRIVEDNGPASVAGVREGDLLVSLAGATLETPDDLYATLEGIAAGSAVPLVILRATETIEVTVEFPG